MTIRQVDLLRNAISKIVYPTAIVKYKIVYIPTIKAYKITLVAQSNIIPADTINEIVNAIETQGFKVYMKTSSSIFNRKVIVLYVVPGATR